MWGEGEQKTPEKSIKHGALFGNGCEHHNVQRNVHNAPHVRGTGGVYKIAGFRNGRLVSSNAQFAVYKHFRQSHARPTILYRYNMDFILLGLGQKIGLDLGFCGRQMPHKSMQLWSKKQYRQMSLPQR